MIIDGFVHQLPDIDPAETQEWLDSLDAVVEHRGQAPGPLPRVQAARAGPRAAGRHRRPRSPRRTSTPSRPSEEPWFPGDEDVERRIRAFIRWNAAVMVVKANKHADGIGGHLATFASSAALYEVGFNHFFRGKDDGLAGDHVYFQGHAAPGIYARAFLEGRLTEDQLDHFRREVGGGGPVVLPAPAPHARLLGVPDGVDGPRPAHARSTRPASTSTSTTARSTTPARRGCGASSATASATSPRRSARSRWPPARASTTSPGSSTATCSASTVRCAATARSSRSSRPSSAAPAGTSSRSSGAASGTSCWRGTSTACCSTR